MSNDVDNMRPYTTRERHDPWRNIVRTNVPGTCLWCGRTLRKCQFDPDRRGYYGDDFFCGLGCGYLFGRAAAKNMFYLRPYAGEV